MIKSLAYYLLYGVWYLLSVLPMWFHHGCARVTAVIIHRILRYRVGVVRRNLANAFPEMTESERRDIEDEFYRFFCDYIAETVKFGTMSHDEVRRRMVFTNFDQVNAILAEGQSVALYLGHYGNWEWITSLRDWITVDGGYYGHIYHPLENEVFDRLFLTFRNRMGSQSIPMNQTLRFIREAEKAGQPSLIGYISDQVPLWQNIHHWVTFFNQETPVFTGVERIVRKFNQAVFYVDVERKGRGYYEATARLITRDPASMPEFAITDAYFNLLEQNIRRAPAYWLWSHNRWKRTREEFDRRFTVVNGRVIERQP